LKPEAIEVYPAVGKSLSQPVLGHSNHHTKSTAPVAQLALGGLWEPLEADKERHRGSDDNHVVSAAPENCRRDRWVVSLSVIPSAK
jgi:hypothetical protein